MTKSSWVLLLAIWREWKLFLLLPPLSPLPALLLPPPWATRTYSPSYLSNITDTLQFSQPPHNPSSQTRSNYTNEQISNGQLTDQKETYWWIIQQHLLRLLDISSSLLPLSPTRCPLQSSTFLNFKHASRTRKSAYWGTEPSQNWLMLVQGCWSISAVQFFGPVGKGLIWRKVPASNWVLPHSMEGVFQDALKRLLIKIK